MPASFRFVLSFIPSFDTLLGLHIGLAKVAYSRSSLVATAHY
jgi:hypothetical protein